MQQQLAALEKTILAQSKVISQQREDLKIHVEFARVMKSKMETTLIDWQISENVLSYHKREQELAES